MAEPSPLPLTAEQRREQAEAVATWEPDHPMYADEMPSPLAHGQHDVRMVMVITLRGGAQIRAGVREVTTHKTRGTGELTGIDWTFDDDPFGTSIPWLDIGEVVAVHIERVAAQGDESP